MSEKNIPKNAGEAYAKGYIFPFRHFLKSAKRALTYYILLRIKQALFNRQSKIESVFHHLHNPCRRTLRWSGKEVHKCKARENQGKMLPVSVFFKKRRVLNERCHKPLTTTLSFIRGGGM